MKVRKWIFKWYVLTSIGVAINLIIAATWVPYVTGGAEKNTLTLPSDSPYVFIDKPPGITEDCGLVVELDDGSKFSITIKEARALREVVRMLLEERIADLEAELFAARGGTVVGTTHPEHELHLLEALAAKLGKLQDILSAQERN